MTVGIITFTRTINYGALLQCYALQRVLESIGDVDVNVIDYKQPYVEEENKVFSVHRFKKYASNSILDGMRYVRSWKHRKRLYDKYKSFKNRYIKCTKPCNSNNIPSYFDIYILGSDQLWTLQFTGGIDDVFWGRFMRKPESRLFSYAISTNSTSLYNVPLNYIIDSLSKFNVVSLREKDNVDVINQWIDNHVRVDLDPTLLLGKNLWDGMLHNKWKGRKYIIVYQVRRLTWKKNDLLDRATEYAGINDLEVIDLSDYRYTADEFVSAIYYSQGVITTSFHGSAFAVIFHKPIVLFRLDDGHDGRCVNLLTQLGLNYIIQPINEKVKFKEINWFAVDEKLSNLRKHSIDYLKQIVSKTEFNNNDAAT